MRSRCERCGHPSEPQARFCSNCGAAQAPLREQRKYVTALFADIEGSTAMVAGVDPEEAASRIEPALAAMREAVRGQQGAVNRVVGDGIMALFGAPLAQEDHAERACAAALQMIEEVPRRTQGVVRIRVGLHSGEVLLRGVENDFSTVYDAMGEVPHLAHRMEELAGPNQIRMTGQTFRLAEGHVHARSLGSHSVHGLASPIEVLELLGRRPVPDRWALRAARGLTELVGRHAELAALLQELERAGQGDCRTVQLHGEPGVGKSRLVHELCARARAQGWRTVVGAARERDAAAASRPLVRLLHAWLEVEESESQAQVGARLERLLADFGHGEPAGDALAAHRAGLQSILDLPVSDESWQQLDPPERRSRIVAALLALARAAAQAAPHLLVVEDLHWADEETLSVLGALLEGARGRLLIALTFRPELALPWAAAPSSRIELAPLSESGGRQLLDALMGRGRALAALKAVLLERAGGNPLFLEESVRGLIDAGALQGEPGALRFEGSVQALEVPASVQGAIAARVDRLDPRRKSCLETAAVIGREFSGAVLRALREDPQLLEEDLDALERGGFIYRSSGRADAPWCFKHALVHQVVYSSLTRSSRRSAHARVVGVIESVHGARLAEHVGELAEHAFAGGLWESAARYRLRACIAAQERSASREAVAIFDRTLETFAQMPQGKAILKTAIDLRLVVANALVLLGEHSRLVRTLLEAEELAEAIEDDRRLCVVYNQYSLALWFSGDPGEALAVAHKATLLAARLGNRPLHWVSRFMVGQAHHARGEFREAVAALGEVLQAFSGPAEEQRTGWSGYPAVLARVYLIDSLLELGRLEEAARFAESGSVLADRLGHAFSQAMLRPTVAALRLAEGRPAEAIALLRESLEICAAHDVVTMVPRNSAMLVRAHVHAGDLREAERLLDPVLQPEVYQRSGHYTWVEVFRVAAELRLNQGDLVAAGDLAREAETLCRKAETLGQLAHVLATLARIELARAPATAPHALHEALELSGRLGMECLQAGLRELAEPGSRIQSR